MPELQQPDIVGNFLSSYATAQAQQQAQKDRAFQQQRVMRQDEMAQQQFDQTSQLNQLNIHKAKVSALNELLASVPDGDAAAFEAAKQRALQHPELGLKPEDVAGVTIADLPRLRMETGQAQQALDMKLREVQIAAQRANAAQSYASARAADALANFRTTGGGVRGGGMTGRPMSAGVQGKEDEDIGDIQSIQSVNTQIDNVLSNLKSGDLVLGPFANLGSRALNFAGTSTAGSRNFAEFEATLEKMRNDSLRLNKGVQTEGDAVRAWNEITKYITDPGVVKAQLERVKELNAMAAQQRLQRINIRRARNGYGEFDPAEIGYGGGTQPVGEAAPDDFSDVDALLGLK